MNIAIIEDDSKIREELEKLLKRNHYKVILIENFSAIYQELNHCNPDLILLDINLPFQNGYEICKQIKSSKNIPIIFVTCRNTTKDELMSIEAGGIDFITKPYDTMILLEKIKRAIHLSNPQNYKEISKNGYTLDLHLSILKKHDMEIELTRNEFKILYYFFMSGDRIITKEELLDKLWNDKYYLDENILMVNITRLRKKARQIGINDLIKNVRGMGFKL